MDINSFVHKSSIATNVGDYSQQQGSLHINATIAQFHQSKDDILKMNFNQQLKVITK